MTSKRLTKHLAAIIELLSKGLTGRKIAEKLNLPYSTLKDWLHFLRDKGLIVEEFRSSFIQYRVRENAVLRYNNADFRVVDGFLVGNEKPDLNERIVFNRHFLRYSFRILKDRPLPFDKEIWLKNNRQTFWHLTRFNATVRKTSRKVIVDLRPQAGVSPKELEARGFRDALEVRRFLSVQFGIELSDEPVKVGKEHFGVQNDFVAEEMHKKGLVFQSDKIALDNSPKKEGELDLFGVEMAENYQRLIGLAPTLEKRLDVLERGMGLFIDYTEKQEKFNFFVQKSTESLNIKIDVLIEELKRERGA